MCRRHDTQQIYVSDELVTWRDRSLDSTVNTVAKIEGMRATEPAYGWRTHSPVRSHSTNGRTKGKGHPVTCHEGTERK